MKSVSAKPIFALLMHNGSVWNHFRQQNKAKTDNNDNILS